MQQIEVRHAARVGDKRLAIASQETWKPSHWYMLTAQRRHFGTVTRISMEGIELYTDRRAASLRLQVAA